MTEYNTADWRRNDTLIEIRDAIRALGGTMDFLDTRTQIAVLERILAALERIEQILRANQERANDDPT